MRLLFIAFVALLASCKSRDAQKSSETKNIATINLESGNSCSYTRTLDLKSAYSFQSDAEAESALKTVMKQTGLPANFLLTAADVDNAAAVIYKNKRYILYNQRFMEEVKQRTHSNYGALSILAHEVGHHLSGHTLLEKEARLELELEADRFSGFVLAKMGAGLNEACIAMDTYGSNTVSSTHPAKRTRIAAITNGWKEAMEDNQANTIKEVATATPNQKLYKVDVLGTSKYITIRNRSLSPEEYRIGSSGTAEAKRLNEETVITNLQNGVVVEVLSSINKTYYVKAKTSNGEIYGYIVKTFAGQPTIKPI